MAKQGTQKKINQPAPSLLKALVLDIFVRHWGVTTLALLLMVSAMMSAHTSHSSRRFTAELQAQKKQQEVLQIQWEALRLELTTLTEPNRLSSEAIKQLGMKEVTTKNEKVITL